MTRLVSFKIEGLAGRKRPLSVTLQEDLNVFWGLNGTGKTSLLRVLHSALENETAGLARVPFRRAEVVLYSHDGDFTITRSIDKNNMQADEEYIYLDERGDPVRMARWSQTGPKGSPRGRYKHQYLPISRLSSQKGMEQTRNRRIAIDEAAFDEAFTEAISLLWLQLNNQSLVEQQQVQQQGTAQILASSFTGAGRAKRVASALSPERAYTVVREYLRDYGAAGSVSKAAFFQHYTSDLMPRYLVQSIVELREQLDEVRAPIRKLIELLESMFETKKIDWSHDRMMFVVGDEKIPLSGLSSGERQLVLILLECMRAERNTVMIDEPELSMHVDWQEKLIPSIRTVNADAQLIMATHSPEIMANIPNRNIFEL